MTFYNPDGIHKVVISEIDETTSRVTFLEKMGGRWVKLGPAEIWNTEDAIEEYRY